MDTHKELAVNLRKKHNDLFDYVYKCEAHSIGNLPEDKAVQIAFTLAIIAKAIAISTPEINIMSELFQGKWNLKKVTSMGKIGEDGNLSRKKTKLNNFLNSVKDKIDQDLQTSSCNLWRHRQKVLDTVGPIKYVQIEHDLNSGSYKTEIIKSNQCRGLAKENSIVYAQVGKKIDFYILINKSDDVMLSGPDSLPSPPERVPVMLHPPPILKMEGALPTKVLEMIAKGYGYKCIAEQLAADIETQSWEVSKKIPNTISDDLHYSLLKAKDNTEKAKEIVECILYTPQDQTFIEKIISKLNNQIEKIDAQIDALIEMKRQMNLECGHTVDINELIELAVKEDKGILEVQCSECKKLINREIIKQMCDEAEMNKLLRKEYYICLNHSDTYYELFPYTQDMICRKCIDEVKCRVCFNETHPGECRLKHPNRVLYT